MKYKESDMYEPIRNMLTAQGFLVRGEVKGCDIAATKGDVLWVVEMKLHGNITLIYQAMERQAATGWVFVAIPRPRSDRDGNFRKFKKLVKKLQLGLITVALDSPAQFAEIIVFPVGKDDKKNKKTMVVQKEITGRTVDTIGGNNKAPINTAFRESCVAIACLLEQHGPLSPRALVGLGCRSDTGQVLYTNVFGWFQNISRGVYDLSEKGREYLAQQSDSPLVLHYRMHRDVCLE